MDLMENEKFNTMKARVVHRDVVTPTLNEITSQHPKLWWLEQLEKEMVGCAPILHLDEVFADPHAPRRHKERTNGHTEMHYVTKRVHGEC